MTKKSKVALISGNSRFKNIYEAIELLRPEIVKEIRGKKKVIIKPNFVTVRNQLSATHVEVVKAVLEFLKPIYKGKILITEKAAIGTTEEGFVNYHYYDLAKDYNVEFLDLTKDKFLPAEIFNASFKKIKIGIAKTILGADFIISVTPAKTHDTGIVTLSLKNVIMGSLDNPPLVHQGYKAFNFNLAFLARKIHPHLSVIDGFEGMGGDGPIFGVPVKSQFAIASLDFLAADTAATKVMGFNPQKIGYLSLCQKENLGEGDLQKIEISGTDLALFKVTYPKPPTYEKQLRWNFDPTFSEKIKAQVITTFYPKIKDSPLVKIRGFNTVKRLVKKTFGFS